MNKLLQALRDLRRATDEWDLDDYGSHAWRLTRNVWVLMILLCIALGSVLPSHNPAKIFDEYRPFTFDTVILLGIRAVVCMQCGRLTPDGVSLAQRVDC
jgi:hypothetical protein